MKWYLMMMAAMVCMSAQVCMAVPVAEKFFVVRVVNYDRTTAVAIKSETDLKKTQAEITAEAALYPKAIENAKKEWKKDADFGKKPFPSTSIGKRKCDAVGTPFPSAEKAETKRSELATRDAEMAAKKTQHDAAKAATMKKEDARKNADSAKEKEGQDAKAVELFTQELARLKPDAGKK